MKKKKLFITRLILFTLFLTTPLAANLQSMKRIQKNTAEYIAKRIPFMASLGMDDSIIETDDGSPFYMSLGYMGAVGFLGNMARDVSAKLPSGTDISPLPIGEKTFIPSAETIFGRMGLRGASPINFELGIFIDAANGANAASYYTSGLGFDFRFTRRRPGYTIKSASIAIGVKRFSSDLNYIYGGSLGNFHANYESKTTATFWNLNISLRVDYDVSIFSMATGLRLYYNSSYATATFAGNVNPGGKDVYDQDYSLGNYHGNIFWGMFYKFTHVHIGGTVTIEPLESNAALTLLVQGFI